MTSDSEAPPHTPRKLTGTFIRMVLNCFVFTLLLLIKLNNRIVRQYAVLLNLLVLSCNNLLCVVQNLCAYVFFLQLVEYTYRDYILNWYQKLSDNDQFNYCIAKALQKLIIAASERYLLSTTHRQEKKNEMDRGHVLRMGENRNPEKNRQTQTGREKSRGKNQREVDCLP